MPPPTPASSLAAELARAVSGEVRFDAGSRAAYAHDASNYRQVPIGVVVPRSLDDIVETVRVCRAHGAPILARGGGTSQNGQCVNVAVVIDSSRHLNRVRSVDPAGRTALVEPGVVCDVLREAAEAHRLTFGPDPATHSRCTLGGMIGNNSCGPHSVMAGKTVENVDALEVLTYDGARFWVGETSEMDLRRIIGEGGRRGDIYRRLAELRDRYGDLIRAKFPKIPRRVSGYNLDQLLPENGFHLARALVGSEGTCALTLQARVKLVASPQGRVLLVLGYADIYAAGDAVPEILRHSPIATEGLDWRIIGGLKERGLRLDDIARLPEGRAWLMVEFGGDTRGEAAQRAREAMAALGLGAAPPSMLLLEDPADQTRIWTIRETGASATALSLDPREPDPVVGWEDAAVDPLRLGDYLREFQALIDRHGYRTSLYGHFGDGCIHARITFDSRTAEGLKVWRTFLVEAAELVVKYGGSLSGEHGDGQAKGEFLPVMYGPELMQALREFKAIWDPENRMNPGKLIDALPFDANLRLGPDYRPAEPQTRFAFGADDRRFPRAVERCIGMGKCRSATGGVMCPSYRMTGEETHATRGRARLLHEMLRGEVIADGWQSDAVYRALEMCLACKGCKHECPTHVDMATWKAEFLSHYHEKKPRPRQAWSMGRIGDWAPLAARLPRLANFLAHWPGLATMAKSLAGIAPERSLPRFARRTFREEFSAAGTEGPRVLLWPDTFNNHFRPATAHAAARVLAHAGCRIELPPAGLCCGRPLYDAGFLGLARTRLRAILDALDSDIGAGTPLVGLEPSCVSVFRDELPDLLADDPRARRLAAQTFTLAEYLEKTGWQPPRLEGEAVVHGHCHQKAVLSHTAEMRLLEAAGLSLRAPEAGCCGMGGGFGFRPENYALSLRAAEQALLPAVRSAVAGALIVASGFSCREQIEQGTGRVTLHLAEVLARAIEGNL